MLKLSEVYSGEKQLNKKKINLPMQKNDKNKINLGTDF
jgi:hypothetical protein